MVEDGLLDVGGIYVMRILILYIFIAGSRQRWWRTHLQQVHLRRLHLQVRHLTIFSLMGQPPTPSSRTPCRTYCHTPGGSSRAGLEAKVSMLGVARSGLLHAAGGPLLIWLMWLIAMVWYSTEHKENVWLTMTKFRPETNKFIDMIDWIWLIAGPSNPCSAQNCVIIE